MTSRNEPPDSLHWLRRNLGSDATLGPVIASGASSSVRSVTANGRRAVLKQITNEAWLSDRPDLVAYEARVLQLLDQSSLRVPTVLAVDPTGDEAGRPSLLMSSIDGAPAGDQPPATQWLDALVETAVTISTIKPPSWIRPYRRYLEAVDASPPPWTKFPATWERAIEVVTRPAPRSHRVFSHRDFHPWNVLWQAKVVGVVDWSQTSVGPAAIDVSHCRHNLAVGFAPAVADEFRRLWTEATGREHPLYWDLVSCVDLLPDWVPSEHANSALDNYVRNLVSEHG